jgi:hypothetical protein
MHFSSCRQSDQNITAALTFSDGREWPPTLLSVITSGFVFGAGCFYGFTKAPSAIFVAFIGMATREKGGESMSTV